MSIIHYDKLVRDRIPDIIAAAGGTVETRALDDAEFLDALKTKLVEEAQEAAATTSQEDLATEVADVVEVLSALLVAAGLSYATVEAIRERRAVKRGGFESRGYLKSA